MTVMHAETRETGLRLCHIEGRLDIVGISAIEQLLLAEAREGARVVVDLGAVDFISSTGIRTFMTLARELHAQGGILVLATPGPQLAEVLRLTGVDQVIPVASNVEEGMRRALG